MKAMDVALQAKKEIQALTGLDAETVSSIQHQGDGWVVTIDMIELHMTPNSRDVLAIYDVQLDNEGSVMGYRRIGRYVRSQVEITNG